MNKQMFKMKDKSIKAIVFIAILAFLCACSQNDKRGITTHLPFKTNESDRWGLIGTDGKILFENEFENEPSIVMNGIFHVKNIDGHYEYYTAEKKPQRIGDKEYIYAGSFEEDVAPVTEPEQHISFIRRDGSTAFVLDYYKDEEITEVAEFSNGLARFKTQKNKYGYINTKGEFVIPPRFGYADFLFGEGLAVVWENDSTAYVINTKGEKQFNLKTKNKSGKPIYFGGFQNGVLGCGYIDEYSNITYEYFLNKKGEKVLTIPSNITVCTSFFNGYALFSRRNKNNDIYWGVIDRNGEIIIRPKYKSKNNINNELGWFVYNDLLPMEDNGKYGLIDLKGNVICPFQFDEIGLFYGGKYVFAKEHDAYHLIDKNGKEVDRKEYEVVTLGNLHATIKSDYYNITGILSDLFQTFKGKQIEDLSIGMPLSAVRKVYNLRSEESYRNEYFLRLAGIKRDDISSRYCVYFDQNIVEPVYSGYWELSTTGYAFNNNAKIVHIIIGLVFESQKERQSERVDEAIKKYFTKGGYEYKFHTEWNDSEWDIYQRTNSKYLIGFSKESRSEWGNYNIVISSNE
jgi:hypothetical protein